MNQRIQKGDVVTLKSDDIKMTVIHITNEGFSLPKKVKCTWFLNGELKEHDFAIEALRKIS